MALSSHDWTIVAAGVVQALHLAVTWQTRHKEPPAPKDWFLEVPPEPIAAPAAASIPAPPVQAAHTQAAEPANARPAHPDHSRFSKNGKRKTINL